MNFVLHTLKIPPERIVFLGQSLGTAVASAVALRFVDPSNDLLPMEINGEGRPLLRREEVAKPTTFAGIVLVAPFSSLPSLMLTYRIGGFIPVLLPVRPIPPLARYLTNRMVDKWPTAERLRVYYDILTNQPRLLTGVDGRTMGSLQIFHATNDYDISYRQTEMICQRMLGEDEKCVDRNKDVSSVDLRRDDRPKVRFEILEYGG